MSETAGIVQKLTDALSSAVPEVDEWIRADDDRWDEGIGPCQEERQVETLIDESEAPITQHVTLEEQYPSTQEKCDIIVDKGGKRLAVEAKLIRYRRDNGDIEPNMERRVFTAFPRRGNSLVSDAKKLHESGFENYATLAIFYADEAEEYNHMTAENIAEKYCSDINIWYGIEATPYVSEFDGLRHEYHNKGAVISWDIA